MRPRTPTAAKVRVLLATFLVRKGEVVSTEALIDELWGDEPPRTVTTTLQVYISQLRTLLSGGADGMAPRDGVLQTQPPGYRLTVGPDELDLTRFEALAASGRRAYERGDHEEARSWLREALGLWTGAALSGVPHGSLLSAAAVHLEESRLSALELRIAAELRIGLHRELTAELLALAAEHPYRETLHGHVMVALYRSERQSDALQAFRDLRSALIDELGVEPGPGLTRLHERILRSDPGLAWHGTDRGAGRAPVFWLPPAAPELVGRDRVLATADRLLTGKGDVAPTRTLAVSGRSGVGKTAFVVELARRHGDHFPDGQVLVRLRDADNRSLDPAAVALAVLRRVESARLLAEADVDVEADAQRELGRALRGRRLLLILDDVVSEEQVHPVAGALDRGVLLVTSRRALVGLESAKHLTLDVLTAGESERLLADAVGERITDDPSAAGGIVRLCGRLPLALRVAGAALGARPHWSAATLRERLADEHHSLDLLSVGDLDVRAALLVGYREIGAAEQRAFRLLSLAPEPGFTLWAAAALLGGRPGPTERLLERLVEARLLEVSAPGHQGAPRYAYHRLLRALAREQLAATETERQRAAAGDRLARAYLALARHADRLLLPGRTPLRGRPADPDSPDALHDVEGAPIDAARIVGPSPARWFQEESTGLRDAIRHAYAAGRRQLVCSLVEAFGGFLEASARTQEWAELLDLARHAAERADDGHGRAGARLALGDLAWQQRRTAEAAAHYAEARRLYEDLDDPSGIARCLIGSGDTALSDGDVALAERCYTAAAGYEPDRRTAIDIDRGLALVDLMSGRAEDALRRFQDFSLAAEHFGDQRWSRFGQRSVVRILEHLVDWYNSQRHPAPSAVELRPGVWLLRSPAGVGVPS
ncbi:AfsR/SARP family transcriptional regulator [Streptacidiphilus rugosus]|uniref:AfsR/SARP family transcriptional regulator n=1 Tax=Streptacidiphilus rugosus TaxID=405783 RepID=UPI001E389B77|nr:AfsR/SARP family transcriptional regulator [Streptacidiphilus rugosus]